MAKCQNCEREDAVRYHQNTKFVDEERNWVTLCPPCAEENDEYWADMWSQYYQGCM
jgi:protein-arginine kinase activator protein McsA